MLESEDKERILKEKQRQTFVGPATFVIAAIGTLVFFWWLLIYDHGVVVTHG